MSSKNNKRSYKKLIYICAYLVILPIFLITSFFIITYQNNKPTLFTTTDLNSNEFTPKIVKKSKIDSFEFEFRCKDYRDPNRPGNLDENGNIITGQTMYFEARIYSKKDGIEISNTTYTVVLASKWIGYQSNKSSNVSLNLVRADEETFTQATISSFNQKYPARFLGLFKIKTPTAYVLLRWEETNKAGTKTLKAFFLEYSYDEYFVEGVTLGGVEA